MAFDYHDAAFPIREDLPAAFRGTWQRIAAPGSFWSGAERVAIAEEVRVAGSCALCRERKQALSPYSVRGEHSQRGALPAPAVDAVHRITTDPGRLSRSWFQETLAAGLSEGQYVELLGVVVALVSIDAFHHALGLPAEPLPAPRPGPTDGHRPAGLRDDGAWVPMIAGKPSGPDADLWARSRTGNVIRAMSLVPDAVRELKNLSEVMYIPMDQVVDMKWQGDRALERPQVELVAARISALNECFY